MQKIPLNNSASRLYEVLRKLKSQDANKPAIDAWRAVLRLGSTESFEVFERFGRVMALPKRVREEILKIPNLNHEIFLRWTSQAEAAFAAHRLSGPLREFISHFDQSTMDRIEFCADRLSLTRPEKELSPQELQKLRAEAEQIRREVSSSDLPRDLKEYITVRLAEVILAIDEYDFLGITPLQQAVEAAVGSVMADRSRTERVSLSDLGKRFLEFVGWTAIFIGLIHNLAQLPQDVRQFVPQERIANLSSANPRAPIANSSQDASSPRAPLHDVHKRNQK